MPSSKAGKTSRPGSRCPAPTTATSSRPPSVTARTPSSPRTSSTSPRRRSARSACGRPATDYSSLFSRDPDGDLVAVGTSAGNWATLTDTHGDLVAAFTTTGTLTDSRSYDPFGEPVVAGNPAVHVGFQGSWTDPDTDRVSAQARWYTPGTGTFASRDTANLPISGTAAANRYTYADANPLTYNDPTGFFADPIAGALRLDRFPSPIVYRAAPATHGPEAGGAAPDHGQVLGRRQRRPRPMQRARIKPAPRVPRP